MTAGELDALSRAHELFSGVPCHEPADVVMDELTAPASGTGMTARAHRLAIALRGDELTASRGTDAELFPILAAAIHDHHDAHYSTAAVLAAARADRDVVPNNPIAAREQLRRKVIRLRTQRGHVMAARSGARRRQAALMALRYRRRTGRALDRNARVGIAVRAALSRLGCPYVWGAGGPDRFDCSGLVKWAYEQAGVRLHRTTYDQINDGVPIPLGQVRAGDLVFPHAGHVQMAIGADLVVEAPYPGANVQISRLGSAAAIRRPW